MLINNTLGCMVVDLLLLMVFLAALAAAFAATYAQADEHQQNEDDHKGDYQNPVQESSPVCLNEGRCSRLSNYVDWRSGSDETNSLASLSQVENHEESPQEMVTE